MTEETQTPKEEQTQEQPQVQKTAQPTERQTIIIQPPVQDSNPLGTAGFVLSIVAILLACIPFLGFIIWLLGLIFSIIGATKQPKGFAIAGLIISLIGLILLILMIVGLFGLSALSAIAEH